MARHQDRFPWRQLIARWFGLDDADAALDLVEARAILKAGIDPTR
jgi:hypothetical protein